MANSHQENTDNDTYGDACDCDEDNNGILDKCNFTDVDRDGVHLYTTCVIARYGSFLYIYKRRVCLSVCLFVSILLSNYWTNPDQKWYRPPPGLRDCSLHTFLGYLLNNMNGTKGLTFGGKCFEGWKLIKLGIKVIGKQNSLNVNSIKLEAVSQAQRSVPVLRVFMFGVSIYHQFKFFLTYKSLGAMRLLQTYLTIAQRTRIQSRLIPTVMA